MFQGAPPQSPRIGIKNSALHEIDFPPPPSDLPSEDSTPQPASPSSAHPLPSSPSSLQNRFFKYRDKAESSKSATDSVKFG